MQASYRLYIKKHCEQEAATKLSQSLVQELLHKTCPARMDPLRGAYLSFEMLPQQKTKLLRELLMPCRKQGISYVLLPEFEPESKTKLIAFDMDLTLIRVEIVEELAKGLQQEEQIRQLTQAAMEGRMDFETSFSKRLELLAGTSRRKMQTLAENLELVEGIDSLLYEAREQGICSGIITGGIQLFAQELKLRLGLDFAYSSKASFDGDKLIGNQALEILTPELKALRLATLAQQQGLGKEQLMALGDGANDLPMLDYAGKAVLFCAKAEDAELSFLKRFI